MLKKFKYDNSHLACVTLRDKKDLILYPYQIYWLETKLPLVKRWQAKGLIKEVD